MFLGVFSPFELLEDLEKDQYKFFFVCLVEFPNEAIWYWTFVCSDFFKLQFLFYFQRSVCSDYLFLLTSILLGCMFLTTCTFLLGCLIYCHITVHSILLWVFIFLQYWLVFIPFHFLFCFCPLSLFLRQPGQDCGFCLSFQKAMFWYFCFFFLFFNSFISSLIFIKSLFLLTLVFVCSSVSNSLGNRLGYLFQSFSCFLRKACITINFPQRTAFAASHRFCVWLYFHCHLSQSIFEISSLISLIHFFFKQHVVQSLYNHFFPYFSVIDFKLHAIVVRKDA